MMGLPVDISAILEKADIARHKTDAAMLAIQSNTNAEQTLQNSTAQLYRSIGDSSALISTTQGTGKLQVEEAVARSATNLGSDLLDSMGKQAQDAAALLAAQDKRTQALATVNQKKSISFFDNPIDWLTAQFTINNDIDRYNAANSEEADAESRIQERNVALGREAQNAALQQRTVSTASIAASAEQAKNLALIQANEASRQAYLTNSAGVMTLVSLSGKQLTDAMQVFNARTSQEQLRISQEHLDLSREEFDWKRIQKKQGESASQYVVDTINRGLTAMDPTEPLLDVNSPKILAILQGKTPLDGLLKRAFDLGETNRRVDPSGKATRILGTTPTDMLETLKYNPAIAPDQKAGVSLIIAATQDARLSPQYKQLEAAKDIEGMKRFVNASVQTALDDQARVVRDQSNVYYLPPIGNILQNIPGLSELPLVSKVLAPAIAAKVDLSDPQKVYVLGLQAAMKGDVSLNGFVQDMSTIYKAAQLLNVESKQLKGMGLTPEIAYRVEAPLSFGVIGAKPVDFTSPTELLRKASKDAIRSTGPFTFGSNFDTTNSKHPAIAVDFGVDDPAARDKAMFPPYGLTGSRR